MPYALEVLSERREKGLLMVRGELIVKELLPPNAPTAIRLTTYADGVVVATKARSLGEILAAAQGQKVARVTVGQRVPFVFEVPTEGATDYQMNVVWGDDAAGVLPVTAPPPVAGVPPAVPEDIFQPSQRVDLVDIRTEKVPTGCTPVGCTFTFRLSGKLRNTGNVPISGVQLGVGFMLLGQEAKHPDMEETLNVTGLALQPNTEKAFRVNVERAVTLEEAARVVPSVRIVAVQ